MQATVVSDPSGGGVGCPPGLAGCLSPALKAPRQMKLSVLLSAAFLAIAPAANAESAAPPQPKPYSFVRSAQFDLPSKISGRTYRIFVHTPPTPPPPGGYPVLYVTDGNGTFPVAAGQAELEA